MARVAATALLLSLLLCTGCTRWIAPLYDEVVPTRVTLDDYERLYPRYVGICAVTQYRRADGQTGGIPGHAAMLIHGACRDPEAPYPRLRPCRPDDDHAAVGVSVNRWFRNVNWVATPGTSLFISGEVGRRERLDEARVHATAERALATGMYRGVKLHDYPTDAPERSLEDFVLRHSLGTDFALRFGRSILCAFLPVEEEMLVEVIDFLNDLNAEYAEGEADYNWSGYSDNCVHTLRNALAAAGIWEPKSVQATKLRQLFNLAVPANETVNLGWLGTHRALGSFAPIHGDRVMRTTFEEHDWLPTRHGALVQAAPVHQLNEVYDTRTRILVLQNPFTTVPGRRAERLLNDARFTEVDVNLYYWRARYRAVLERRPDPDRLSLRSRNYRDLEQRYYDYVERQLAEVEALIERFLAEEDASTPEPR